MTGWTLAEPVTLTGNAVRLHAGEVRLTLAPGDAGFVFRRADTDARLPADLEHLVAAPNCTALGRDGRPEVLFVEHVLSALAGLGYTAAEITVDGPEVPLFDGSALPLVEALATAGREPLTTGPEPLVVTRPIWQIDREQCVGALPAAAWSVHYGFEHAHPMIAADHADFGPTVDYATEIAPARTFATVEEIEALRAAGLVQGGSEANILVVLADGYSSPLRSEHEFATHKVLDLIGDLALLGQPLIGRLVAYRTGHSDNHALARKLLAG